MIYTGLRVVREGDVNFLLFRMVCGQGVVSFIRLMWSFISFQTCTFL